MVKDSFELTAIRHAIQVAERAFAMFLAMARETETEKDLADAMEAFVRRAGGSGSSFPPIIATDARSALPHAIPTDHRLGDAGCLLVDWGACADLYRSDLTRVRLTRPGSAVESEVRKIYTVARDAQSAGIRAIRPGTTTGAVDAAARGVIAAAGFGRFFNHGLGHGIGLQIHEGPFCRPNTSDTLVPGMVITVEPGIYLPGVAGVRIEDDVLVTPEGCEVLTHVSRELDSIFEA
jgi:Xaa-Pro aminopeptidase